ncbi:MAG TPA: hypothetical protein VIA18_17680 [Polyangia bacterium]|jgi:hypothetical protein|nr:hypothetical protein [Polyangia bacterium]
MKAMEGLHGEARSAGLDHVTRARLDTGRLTRDRHIDRRVR